MSKKPILCLDFDGVIHAYSKGWQDGSIYDGVTEGFFDWAARAKEHFSLVVYSSRSSKPEGLLDMQEWMLKHLQAWLREKGIGAGDIPPLVATDFTYAAEKPPAFVTIDDRAITFDGNWSSFGLDPDWLIAFKPWNQQ